MTMNFRPTSARPYHKHQTTAIECYAYYLLGEAKNNKVEHIIRRPAMLVSFVFPVSPGKLTVRLHLQFQNRHFLEEFELSSLPRLCC